MEDTAEGKEFELVLDRQIGSPPLLNEALGRAGLHTGVVTICDGLGWMMESGMLYVWMVDESEKPNPGLKRLSLPHSDLPLSSKLAYAFRGGNRKSPSAIAVHPEGKVRWWPSVDHKSFYDVSIVDLQSEVPFAIHLLKNSLVDNNVSFAILTTSGSLFIIRCDFDGNVNSSRLGVSGQTMSVRRRVSSVIFGFGQKEKRTDFARSIAFQMPEDTAMEVVLAISSKTIKAFDTSSNSELWSLNAKESIAEKISSAYAEQSRHNDSSSEVFVHFLHASVYKNGLLVLLTGHHIFSTDLGFYLVHLTELNSYSPTVGDIIALPMSSKLLSYYKITDKSSFENTVRLCIPSNTANSEDMLKTDGIMILHPSYVQSVFVTENLADGVQLSVEKALPAWSRHIGYGMDDNYLYVMLTDGVINKLRVYPSGFPESEYLPVLADMLESTILPAAGTLVNEIYRCCMHFINTDFARSKELAEQLTANNTSTELLGGVRQLMWNSICSIDTADDFNKQLYYKLKLYNFLILFLKCTNIYKKILRETLSSSQTEYSLKGAEAITEMNERISVLLNIVKWSEKSNKSDSVTTDEEDLLRNLALDLTGHKNQTRPSDWKRIEFVHLIPSAAVRHLHKIKDTPNAFKSLDDRYRTFKLYAELLLNFQNGIFQARSKETGEDKWTMGFIQSFKQICFDLLHEMTNPLYGNSREEDTLFYIERFMSFYFIEHPEQPDGDRFLLALAKDGFIEHALHLALSYKDFTTICVVIMTYTDDERQKAVSKFKKMFSEDGFEEFYLNFLSENNHFDELLKQKGQLADMHISALENVRWRRDINKEKFGDAGKTLLVQAEEEKGDLDRRNYLAALAALTLKAVGPEDDVQYEIESCELLQKKIQFQKEIPEDLLKEIYRDDWKKPLSTEELLEIGEQIIHDSQCSEDKLRETILFLGNLCVLDDPSDFVDLLHRAWKRILKFDSWDRVTPANYKNTLFIRLVHQIIAADFKVAQHCIPSPDELCRQIEPGLEEFAASQLLINELAKQADIVNNAIGTGMPPI